MLTDVTMLACLKSPGSSVFTQLDFIQNPRRAFRGCEVGLTLRCSSLASDKKYRVHGANERL